MDKTDWLWAAFGLLAVVMLILILRAPDGKGKRGDKRESDDGSN